MNKTPHHTELATWTASSYDADLNLHIYDFDQEPPKPTEVQIEEIMTCFNWDKTLKAMKAVDWIWIGTPDITVPDLKAHAKGGLRVVAKNGHSSFWACGGFRAENWAGYLSLYFVVSDWDSRE